MESQDTATLFLIKVWPTLEANKNRIIGGLAAIVLLILLGLFLSYEKEQKEVSAGQAFSQLTVSAEASTAPGQLADQYLKLASDYAGTQTAQRAQLQGATDLFLAGRYAEAQAQFQKFADTYPASILLASAVLGVASALEAQNKTNDALEAYKKVTESYNDPASVVSAKFAIGRIYEQQGKISEAVRNYQEVARAAQGLGLGQQANLKVLELTPSLPAKPVLGMPAATAPLVPLTK